MALNAPIHSERHMRIICIGAGASGLCFAYKLQRSFEDFTLKVYDKNDGVGGTWFSNRYPGCCCDYEAHNYTFSWDPKPDWPDVYASASQIRQYFATFAEKHDLLKYCSFGHQVSSADWDEQNGKWNLLVEDSTGRQFSDACDILINATGVLSRPKWPEPAIIENFTGPVVHSATWNESLNLEGQRVGLIGNGSSGQDLLRALQPQVASLTVFIRQPSWITGPVGEAPRAYTAAEIEAFAKNPDALLQKRKQFESRLNGAFSMMLKDSPEQAGVRSFLTTTITSKLPDSAPTEYFIPNYAVGCRRPTPGVTYIENTTSHNVQLVMGKISHGTKSGLVDETGKHHDLDLIVCATGFDTSHIPSFPIKGLEDKNMQDAWREQPLAYLALAAPGYPNYFVFFGPNNPFAGGAFLASVEAQADYMLKFCDRWQTENIRSFAPKREAAQDFLEHASKILKTTVWSDNCSSWFKPSSPGKPVSLWPGSSLHYREAISNPRADDWEIKYNGNRFSWLGNGFSQIEKDGQCDLAYYLRTHDDSEYLGRRKQLMAVARLQETT